MQKISRFVLSDAIQTFLISLSPLGEARVGIPYGVVKGLPVWMAFAVGLTANLLIFPIFNGLIDAFDRQLWRRYKLYREYSVKLMKRAKRGVGNSIKKYGFWGLMLFVMVPFPGTGAYMGIIAARILNISRYSSFMAISLGVIVSSLIITISMYFIDK